MKKKVKTAIFQVLLLNNSPNQDVVVHESDQVDFAHVKKHLNTGGSVFITSKDSQKINYFKSKAQHNYTKSRRNIGLLLHQQLRTA